MLQSRFIRACLAILCVMAFLFVNIDGYGGSSSSGKSSSSSSSKSSSSSSSKSSSSSSGSYGSSVSKPSSSSTTSSTSSGGYGSSVSKPSSSSTENNATPVSNPSSSGYGSSVAKPSDSGGASSGKVDGSSVPQSAKSTAGLAGKSTTAPPKSALQQKLDRTYSKQESAKALDNYKTEQNKFKTNTNAPYQSVGGERAAVDTVRSRVTYTNQSDYYNRREVFYSSSGWSPPGYVYHSYSSFGIWDSMMLWYMLDHIHDAQYRDFYYHHRDDAGMQQFRQELDKMAVENSELKAKVAKLDAETKELEAKGVKVDPTYVPPDATDVALAANIANKEIPVKKGSGFPWFWTLAILAGIGIGYSYYLKRRR